MTVPKLIGIYSSRPQCGKSTIAKRLMADRRYSLVSFAKPMKDMIRTLLEAIGIKDTEEYLYGSKKEVPIPELGGKTVRYLLRTIGTEWGRNLVHPDVWADIARAYVRRQLAYGNRVIVDDLRLPNEYEAIIALGGKLIRVEREADYPVEPPTAAEHSSDGALNAAFFHEVIVNDSTMGKFNRMIDAAMGRLS